MRRMSSPDTTVFMNAPEPCNGQTNEVDSSIDLDIRPVSESDIETVVGGEPVASAEHIVEILLRLGYSIAESLLRKQNIKQLRMAAEEQRITLEELVGLAIAEVVKEVQNSRIENVAEVSSIFIAKFHALFRRLKSPNESAKSSHAVPQGGIVFPWIGEQPRAEAK